MAAVPSLPSQTSADLEEFARALREAALAVSSAHGDEVFAVLVRTLARTLDVEMAFVALYVDDDPTSLEMRAVVIDGRTSEGVRYRLDGTPCATVVGRHFCAYPAHLRELFPLDQAFVEQAFEGYAGFPVNDSQGRALGLIAVVSRRPLRHLARFESILQIYAVRVAAELERQRAEQAVRNREEQYRAIFEGSSDALGVWSRDIKLVDVNQAFTRMYGYTREDSIGRGFARWLPPGEIAPRIEKIRRALAGEEGALETDAVRKDGERFEVELRYLPIVYRDEPHVLVIARDITARKAAIAALQASEEQYRAIFNASADALILWDSHYRRVDVNPAYERIFGWPREEVVGHGYDRPGDAGDYAPPREELVRRALAGEACHTELSSRRKDGTTILIEVDAIPFRHRGEPHVLAIARDITARRAAEAERATLEEQLRQAQKMEAIGQLTGGIAHDFNNILTSVIGYVVLAGERAASGGDAKLVHQLEQARIAAQRARDLIAQMLAFARRQHGQRRAIALAPVVRQAVQLLRATLPSTIELDHQADESVADADAVQLEQVLFNLCINARDAIAGAGRIGVRLRQSAVESWHCASCRAAVPGGRWIELSVTDDGSGIEPAVLERVFEPFYSTKEVGRGSGMGLAMVHGIVHEHGGHLRVVTRSGGGSQFAVMLPPAAGAVRDGAVRIGRDAAPALAAPLRGRVMVVEDQPMVGDFLRELLEGWGLDVVLQRDAEAAVAWLADAGHSIDVLITDQTMPRLTGLELAQQASALRPGLPIVLCTGDAATFDDTLLGICGVGALLRKPIMTETLRSLLQGYVGAAPAQSPAIS